MRPSLILTALQTSTIDRRCAFAAAFLLVTAGCGGVTSETDVVTPSGVRCVVAASTTTRTISHTGGTASITVASTRDCDWTARSDAAWVTVTPTTGIGNATIRVTASSNSQRTQRTARLVVNDTGLDLTQDAAPPPPPPPAATGPSSPTQPSPPNPPAPTAPTPAPAPAPSPVPTPTPPPQSSCTFELNRSSESFDARGGDGDVKVKARSGCAWDARSGDSWLSISSGSGGSGDGEVRYRVAQNSSTGERSGSLSIAGQSFSVRQKGAEPQRVDIDGTVQSISGSCPSLSMRVDSENVTTDSSTKFKSGSCGKIRTGTRVKVKGQRIGGTIKADEVDVD